MTKPALAVRAYGHSIWLDQISRDLLTSGEFARLVAHEGVAGVTANPTIFEKAITEGAEYNAALAELIEQGIAPGVIVERLMVQDLQRAADVLRACYDSTPSHDGFVSIEVSPALAYDTDATEAEVRRLWRMLDRPNAMIKIPATRAGLLAIEAMLYEGINVNITLLFSVARYEQVMEAYLSALERRVAEGKPIGGLRSVASFFVSRVDTVVDRKLDELARGASHRQQEHLMRLRSRAAIANAKVAYQRFKETFHGPRWEALRRHGAAPQRPLWASTSTKDPRLPDTYYVEALIGPDTVDTVPLNTLGAFNDHGRVAPTLEQGTEEARQTLDRLATVGIDLAAVADRLETAGIKAFADSLASVRQYIEEKHAYILARKRARGGIDPRV